MNIYIYDRIFINFICCIENRKSQNKKSSKQLFSSCHTTEPKIELIQISILVANNEMSGLNYSHDLSLIFDPHKFSIKGVFGDTNIFKNFIILFTSLENNLST